VENAWQPESRRTRAGRARIASDPSSTLDAKSDVQHERDVLDISIGGATIRAAA
jgi:hypothetical protein